jgi:hypothetical protein
MRKPGDEARMARCAPAERPLQMLATVGSKGKSEGRSGYMEVGR